MAHANLYSAVFQMSNKQREQYANDWQRKHPGRIDVWEDEVAPYLSPAYMLFCAPLTNPILSLFRVISRRNKFGLHLASLGAGEVLECQMCFLDVTFLATSRADPTPRCLSCLEETSLAEDLDETEEE